MIAALVATLRHPRLERLSRLLALGCAVHCALTPLLLALVPAAAAASGAGATLERVLVATSLLLAAPGLVRGYLRHRRAGALALLAAAALLALLGQLGHGAEPGHGGLAHLLTGAGLHLLLPANLLDHRGAARPGCCHPPHA